MNGTQLQQMLGQMELAWRSGQFGQYVAIGKRLLQRRPNDHRLMYNVAIGMNQIGEHDDALKLVHRAIKAAPDQLHYHHAAASALRSLERFDDALAAYDRALSVSPEDAATLGHKAELLAMLRRHEEAAATLEPALAHRPVNPTAALAFARIAPATDASERAVELLTEVIETPGVDVTQRRHALYRKGSLLDRLGRHDDAFATIERANASRTETYNPDDFTRRIDGIIESWTQAAFKHLPTSGLTSTRPIFIVSPPRSGSTLVEQILASHPDVAAAGETYALPRAVQTIERSIAQGTRQDPQRLRANDLKQAGRTYLAALRGVDETARHVTDKMLTNFQRLGLIALLFPGARIIDCVRHPFDTALSCYFQDFLTGNLYTNNLGHMARFIVDYRRLMDHWASVIPTPILTIRYEDLVSDQQRETRRLLEFVGLPWRDECIEFHRSSRTTLTASNQQVTQPMYQSSKHRYRNYEAHLGPLIEVFGEDPS